MAKVGFWLQGSKGKLSGASLSQTKNGTVIRNIVTPKNPRTDKQMSQRVIFATIAKAASVMKPIINHSFEGLEDGDACIKEFRKLNLFKLRNSVAADIAAENDPDELFAYLAPKGYPYITPNAYIVSRGSIAAPNLSLIIASGKISLAEFSTQVLGSALTRLQFIQEFVGVTPGDQLTFCAINANLNPSAPFYYESEVGGTGQACGENDFTSQRIVFKPYAGNEAAYDESVLTEGAFDLNKLIAIVDFSKSDQILFNQLFANVKATVGAGSVTVSVTSDEIGSANTKAACLVRSQQSLDDSWKYSNATMLLVSPDNSYNYGLPLEEAVKTYTSGVSIGKDNRPFLDEGQYGGTLSMSSFE